MKGETQGEKENCKGTSTKILIRKNQLKDRNHQGIKKITGTKSIHLNARKKITQWNIFFQFTIVDDVSVKGFCRANHCAIE